MRQPAIGCSRASILLFDESGVMRFVAWRGLSEDYRHAVEGHSPWPCNSADPDPITVPDIESADIAAAVKAESELSGWGHSSCFRSSRTAPTLEGHAGSSAMVLVDIDNLKIINDLRGHSTGDAVVARTADAIRRSLRPRDDCARLGDEFLIMRRIAVKKRPWKLPRQSFAVWQSRGCRLSARRSASIGIAAHEGGGADYARIHREADAALHQARAEGRNRLVVYDATTAPPLHSDHPPQVLV